MAFNFWQPGCELCCSMSCSYTANTVLSWSDHAYLFHAFQNVVRGHLMDCLRPIWYQNLEHRRHVKIYWIGRSNRIQPHECLLPKNVHKIIGAFCLLRRNLSSLSLLPLQTDPLLKCEYWRSSFRRKRSSHQASRTREIDFQKMTATS